MREPHELVAAQLIVLVLVEPIEQPLGTWRRRRSVRTPRSAACFRPTTGTVAISGPATGFLSAIGVGAPFAGRATPAFRASTIRTTPAFRTTTIRTTSSFRSAAVAAAGREELLHRAADRLPLCLV
jgi:hypothetical protein